MKEILGWLLAGAGFAFAAIGVNRTGTKWDLIGMVGFVMFMFALEMITNSKIADAKEELRRERQD